MPPIVIYSPVFIGRFKGDKSIPIKPPLQDFFALEKGRSIVISGIALCHSE
jgi:hypothetical protein